MKRNLSILGLVGIMLLSTMITNAQEKATDIFKIPLEQKRHHFGIGLSSNLFVGDKAIDGFASKLRWAMADVPVNENNHIGFHSEKNFGMFLSYAFDINVKTQLQVALRYNSKSIEYLRHSLGRKEGVHADLSTCEIPVMLRYSFVKYKQNHIFGILGTGLDFFLEPNSMEIKTYSGYGVPDGGTFMLEMNRTTNFFVNFGLGFSCALPKGQNLEFGIRYNWYPANDNFQYKYYNPNNVGYTYESEKFDNNNLVVTIAYYL